MAMHYRGHNNAAGGRAANPFTGRSLPANGARGRDYHGNSPSLVPGMIKKAAFLVLTFVVFFYVYDDEPYEANLSPSVQKKESSGEAVTKSYTDLNLASKPQSEPVQLKLPRDITSDPDYNEFDTSRFEVEEEGEENVESTDYEYQRANVDEEEDEDEEGMVYKNNDPDEQSYDSAGEGGGYDSVEKGEETSAADQIIDSNMLSDENQDGSEDHFQGDSFLGLSDPKEEVDEASTLDVSPGGLRGSKSQNSENENPFGRQEETYGNEEKEEIDEVQGVGSSEDNGVDGTETLYNNSPLEVPNSVVADDPIQSKPLKSMQDEIDQMSNITTVNTTVSKQCEDDPDFRYKGNEEHGCKYVAERQKCDKLHSGEKVGVVSCPVVCDMVDACLTRLNEQELSHGTLMKNDTIAVDSAKPNDDEETSEEFTIKEKDAFEAKYGNDHKTMEDEFDSNNSFGSDEMEKQSPSIAEETADNILNFNQTEAEESESLHNDGLSDIEGVGNQTKSMTKELESEKGDSYDESTEEIEFDGESVRNDTDKAEMMMSNKEGNTDVSNADSQDSVILESDLNVGVDSLENKTVSSVEGNFKEYLITNSEDEPLKDEMEADGQSKHDEDTLVIKTNHTSKKVDEDEVLLPEEQQEAKDVPEPLKKSGGSEDASEPDLDEKRDYKAKKTSSLRGSVDKISIDDSLEVQKVDSKVEQDEKSDVESLAAVADYDEKQSNKKVKTAGKTSFEFESQDVEDEKHADANEEKLYGDESKNNVVEQGEEHVEINESSTIADATTGVKDLSHNDNTEDKPKKKDSNDALDDKHDGGKDRNTVKKEKKDKAKNEKESKTKGKGKLNADLEDFKQKMNEDSNDVVEKDHDAVGDSKAVKKEKKDKTKKKEAGSEKKKKKKTSKKNDDSNELLSTQEEDLSSAVVKKGADTNETTNAVSEALEQGDDNDKDVSAKEEITQDNAFLETNSKVKSVEERDSSDESNIVGEESQVKRNSTDLSQVEIPEGESDAVSNNENKTSSHIDGIEEHSSVNNETKGSGDEGEVQDATEDLKVEENSTMSDVEVSMNKNVAEKDTDQKASEDGSTNEYENAKSQYKNAESIGQDEDEKLVDEAAVASSEVDQDKEEPDNFGEETMYAKIAKRVKKSYMKGGKSGNKDAKHSATAKEVKEDEAIPILGELGEAIKESDEPDKKFDTEVNDVKNSGDENDQGEKTTDTQKEKDIAASEEKTEEDAQAKEE